MTSYNMFTTFWANRSDLKGVKKPCGITLKMHVKVLFNFMCLPIVQLNTCFYSDRLDVTISLTLSNAS